MRTAHVRRLPTLLLAAAFVLCVAPAVLADDDPPISAEQIAKVTSALEAKGYKEIRDVEIDDGRFEADAVHPDGYKVDVELDMQSLAIVHEKRD